MTTRVSREAFLALQQQGLTAPAIAARLGVTPRTVVRYRSRYGVAQPAAERRTALDEAWHAKVRELIADGCSRQAIADITGVTKATVRRYYPEHRMDPLEGSRIGYAHMRATLALRKAGHA